MWKSIFLFLDIKHILFAVVFDVFNVYQLIINQGGEKGRKGGEEGENGNRFKEKVKWTPGRIDNTAGIN